MKKLFLLTTSIIMLICVLTICASAETYGDLTYTVSNGEVTITDCSTSVTSVTIPSAINGYPVTSIGNYAFQDTGLINITIPDSVNSIGNFAFYGCTGLTSVTLSNSLTSIAKFTFGSCTSLTNITIPNSVTSIGDHAFYDCTRLTSITIPDSVITIGSAFAHCKGLTSVTIPSSVINIGGGAFSNCSSLANITIPNSVTSIGDGAFQYCTGLTNVTIPDSVTNIGDYAFQQCSALTSVTIGSGIELISEKAFYSCGVKYIYLPHSLKYIRNDAFNSCSSINTVFYVGSESQWNEIMFYNGNETITNAKIVFNAIKKTYRFETNCDEVLGDITGYAIFTVPTIQNNGMTFMGWYDNESLSGEPVTFPYYGDATTLYASWTDRTGKSFDDAFIVKANQEYTVTTTENGQYVYFEFMPKLSKKYNFYSTGSKDTYGYLYDSNKTKISSNDDDGDGNNFYISYNLTAGETYYIKVKIYSGTGTFNVFIEEPVDYRINSITLKDMSGNELSTILTGTFLATISFTNVSSSADTVIILVQYTQAGAFKGLMYIQTEDVPTGSTIKLSIPVDNTSGDVAKLKAFCWESFSSMTPLGDAVSFPAE